MMTYSNSPSGRSPKPMPEDGILFKATRLDGTDFRTGMVQWAPPPDHDGPWVVRHPGIERYKKGFTSNKPDPESYSAANYLSASVTPHALPGSDWPMRLFKVRAIGRTGRSTEYLEKVAALEYEVVAEIDSSIRFGPQGAQVALLLAQWKDWRYPRTNMISDFARDDRVVGANQGIHPIAERVNRALANDGLTEPRRQATSGDQIAYVTEVDRAVSALMARHLIGSGISQRDYDVMTAPWRMVYGPMHHADRRPPTDIGHVRGKNEVRMSDEAW